MSSGYLAYRRALEIDWLCCEVSWYLFDFDTKEARSVASSVEPDRNRHSDGVAFVKHNLLAIHVVFVEGESPSISAAKLQGRQLFAQGIQKIWKNIHHVIHESRDYRCAR